MSNLLCRKVFKNLLCTNNVINTGSYGKTMRSIVFTNTSTPGINYIWITTAGQEFEEGQYYDISADCDSRKILKRVKILKQVKSEQDEKIKPDALDILLGL